MPHWTQAQTTAPAAASTPDSGSFAAHDAPPRWAGVVSRWLWGWGVQARGHDAQPCAGQPILTGEIAGPGPDQDQQQNSGPGQPQSRDGQRAELIQQMRTNLAGVWRQPAVQEKTKTKRREKDIRAEVLHGYELSRNVIDAALKKHPDQWALVLARASVLHDENNYRKELERDPQFAPKRQLALDEFRRAATLYGKAAAGLAEITRLTEQYRAGAAFVRGQPKLV